MKNPIVRFPMVLIGVSIAVGLLAACIGARVGADRKMTTFDFSRDVLLQTYRVDSWQQMRAAFIYYRRHRRLAEQPGDKPGATQIYTNLLLRKQVRFHYPPTALFIPMAIDRLRLDEKTVYDRSIDVFLLVNVAAIGALLLHLLRPQLRGPPSARDAAVALLVSTTAVLTFAPLPIAASLGQIQVWLNALFAVTFYLYATERRALAGVVLGVMTCIKPQCGLFLLWGVLRRDKRLVVAMAAALAVGFLAGTAKFGMENWFDFLKGLQFLSQRGESFFPNQSVNGLANRLLSVAQPQEFNNMFWRENHLPPHDPRVYAVTVASSALLLVLSFLPRRSRTVTATLADFSVMALGVTMASPIAWMHHYGILLPILLFLWLTLACDPAFARCRRARAGVLVCAALTGNSLPIFNLLAPSYWNVLQSYMLFGAIGVFALLLWMRHRPDALAPPEVGPSALERDAAGAVP
ncbi:MAG: glycosyltransferase family 87 protein [bacterium]